jgi:hypothetical protein
MLLLHREDTKDMKNKTYVNDLRVVHAFAVHLGTAVRPPSMGE